MNKNAKIIIGVLCALVLILVVVVVVVICTKGESVPTGQTNAKGEQVEYVSSSGNVEVVDSGWSAITKYEKTEVYYAAEIENKNNKVAEFISVTVTGKNSEGKILFTETGSYKDINYLFPGEKVSFVGNENWDESEGTPTTIEFTVSVRQWSNVSDFNYPKNMDLEVENTSKIGKGSDYFKITGEIINHSNFDIRSTLAVVTFKKDGKIVGGGFTYVDDIKAEGRKAFEIYSSDIEFDTYEVSARTDQVK